MGLDTFPFFEDHTCLITYANTIYKLKLIYQGLNDRTRDGLSQVCSERSAHCQIEDVFRAVLYNIEREKQLNPIRTQNFIIYPESHVWPLGQKVCFRDGSKCYRCHENFIKFTVMVHGFGVPENENQRADPVISNSGHQQAGNHSDAQSKVQPNANALDPQRQKPSELHCVHSGNNESNMRCKLGLLATPGLRTNTNEGSQSPQKASTLAAMLKKHNSESRHTSCSVVIKLNDQITTSELGKRIRHLSDGICEDLGVINNGENTNENKSKGDTINLTSEISDKRNNLPKGGKQLRSKTAVDETEQNKKTLRESALHARKMIKQITDKVENVGSQSSLNQASDQTSTGSDNSDDNTPVERKEKLVTRCMEKFTDETFNNTSGKRQSRNISFPARFSMRTRQKPYHASQKLGFYRALRARSLHKTQMANSNNGHRNVGSAVKKRQKDKICESQLGKKSKPKENGINVKARVIKRKRLIQSDLSDTDFNETESPKKTRSQSKIYNGHGDAFDNKRKVLTKPHPRHTRALSLRHTKNEDRRLTVVPDQWEPRFDAEEQEDTSIQETECESIETVDYNNSTPGYENERLDSKHARAKDENNAQLHKHNMSHAVKFGKKRSLRSSLTPQKIRKEDQTGETDQHDDSLDVSDEEVVEVFDDGSIIYERDKVQSVGEHFKDISLAPEKMQDSTDSPKRGRRANKRLLGNTSDVISESDSTCSISSPRREKNALRRGMKVGVNSIKRNSCQNNNLGHSSDQIHRTLVLRKSLRQKDRQGQGSKPQNANTGHKENYFNPRDRTKADEIDKEDLPVYNKSRVTGKKMKLCQTATDFVFTTGHSACNESRKNNLMNKEDKKNSNTFPDFSQERQRAVKQPLTQTEAFSAADDIECRPSHQKRSEHRQKKVDNDTESPRQQSLTLRSSTSNVNIVQMKSPNKTGSSKKSTSPDRASSRPKSYQPSPSSQAQSNGPSLANLNSPSPRKSSRTKRLTPKAQEAFKAASEQLLSGKDGVWLFGRGPRK